MKLKREYISVGIVGVIFSFIVEVNLLWVKK